MSQLSNIQTYEKLSGDNFKPPLDKFAKVLKRIGLWNKEIESEFETFAWKVEDNVP